MPREHKTKVNLLALYCLIDFFSISLVQARPAPFGQPPNIVSRREGGRETGAVMGLSNCCIGSSASFIET